MPWQELLDWLFRGIVLLGGPGVVIKFIRDGKKNRAIKGREQTAAIVDEQTAQDKVITSSITTQETARLAMAKAFDAERTSLQRTIEFLTSQLDAARNTIAQRDVALAARDQALIDLHLELTEAMEQVRVQAAKLTELAERFDALQEK